MKKTMTPCHSCGLKLEYYIVTCPKCGLLQGDAPQENKAKSRISAGLLAVLLGSLGLHKFYLGAWGWGLVYLLLVWSGVPTLFGLIEGIRYLSLSEDAFQKKLARMDGAFGFLW